MQQKNIIKEFVYWNKKLHIHLGLALLFFLWLFSVSGLLLNHSNWQFARFWEERKETKKTIPVEIAPAMDSAAIVQWVKLALQAKGEASEVHMYPDSLDFRVAVPGHLHTIHVDFKKKCCTDKETRFNIWGIMRTLHTANAVVKTDPSRPVNWWLSAVWRFAMDAVAVGLILLCCSSYIMWYRLGKGLALGWTMLGAGLLGAIYFLYILKMR